MTNGGYDDGYEACPCFWGTKPGRFVRNLVDRLGSVDRLRILDAGCGEGKNAHFLSRLGAQVTAVDISKLALQHAVTSWPGDSNIQWVQSDIREACKVHGQFDIVIAYGLLHCLPSASEVIETLELLQAATLPCGYNVICSFNGRKQELALAHPGFEPTLLAHECFCEAYAAWEVLESSDEDLNETHPDKLIPHTHSLTRLLTRKPQ